MTIETSHNPMNWVCGFFCVYMDQLYTLFFIWTLVQIILALIWYIWTQHENMYWEQEAMREERNTLLLERGTFLQHAAEERKDLYDRIQAGTLPQYKEHQSTPDNDLDEAKEDEIVDLDEAKEELMGVQHG